MSSLLLDLRTFALLIVISIFLSVVDQFGLLDFIKSGVQVVTLPIQYGLYKTYSGVERQFEFIVLARRASQENKAMTEQLAQVLSENANLRRKLAETEGFAEQEKTLSPLEFSLVPARPIGVNRYLLIDKGSDDGIKVSQAVIYKDNYIGEVKEVTPKKAQVMLSSDPDSKISAFVSGKDGKARGILLGQFGSEMLLDKILHQEPVVVGDLVYSEGTEVEIPRGLIVGQISEVISIDNQVFKQAKVKPVFDVSSLDILFVVTN